MTNGTAQECVLDLLQYIGVTGFTPAENSNRLNRPGLDDTDTNRAVAAINSALQVITRFAPNHFSFTRRSVNIAPALGVVVSATNGGGITFLAAPPAWTVGSSVRVSGDATLNEITALEGTAATLLHPYAGTTNPSISAVLYNDALHLDSDVRAVMEPVRISPNNRLLRPAASRVEFDRFSYQANGSSHGYEQLDKQPGDPTLFIVESLPDKTLYLRLNPMPNGPSTLIYSASTRPERITRETALGEQTNSDPEYLFTSLSLDLIESVLMPIARQKFSVHPSFKNLEARRAIGAEYAEVMKELRQGSTLNRSVTTQRALYI